MGRTLREQLSRLKATLKEQRYPAEDAAGAKFLDMVVDVILNFAGTISDAEKAEIESLVCKCFSIKPAQWQELIAPKADVIVPKKPFDDLVPDGWFREYIGATMGTEPPTAYHFFCAATILGALTERKIWVSKGFYRVYPCLNVILIGPTGKCRKSAAIGIAKDIAAQAEYDKMVLGQTTPEAFIMALGGVEPASCLIVGGEMKRFFHGAKYMDGFIPLITDLIDAPDEWSSMTVSRSKLKLKNVMISSMYGTTMDWLKRMPPDLLGGGFIRRHIAVVQDRTDRIVAIPEDFSAQKKMLSDMLRKLATVDGEFMLVDKTRKWYEDWYMHFRTDGREYNEELFEGYLESKPDHVLRLAMLIRLSQGERELTIDSLANASEILDWTEQFLPSIFANIGGGQLSVIHNRILDYIRRAGGRMSKRKLTQRMSKWLTSAKLMEHIYTLKEAGYIEERAKTAMEPLSYYLKTDTKED
jgi:hypothetical protein